MSTKVTNSDRSPIPAGIFSGIEAFWCDNEKWVIAHGTTYRYNEAPTVVKSTIQKAFMADKQSLAYMAKMGLRKANEIFDTWFKCVVGGLDSVADFDRRFTPDAYNNMCADTNCPHRGRLCGRASALRNYEVETLAQLATGNSMKTTSEHLFITRPGIRSRVDQVKEKLNAPNMAALMHRAAELGI
jgi:DNA-binding CsgD family transcriptional regulator